MKNDRQKAEMDRQTEVEDAVLSLLRGEDAKNFTLALTCRADHCAIFFADLDALKICVLGTGGTLAEAWNKRTAFCQ